MKLSLKDKGMKIDLGKNRFTSEEIIAFAKRNDPLDFHLSYKAAKKSRFKGLVTSGGQAFNFFYVHRWVPKYGDTVEAGLGIDNWNFITPIYADQEVNCNCQMATLTETSKKDEIIVDWYFQFSNIAGQLYQELTLKVLHKN